MKVHSVNLATNEVQERKMSVHIRQEYASVNVDGDIYLIGGIHVVEKNENGNESDVIDGQSSVIVEK